MSVTDSPGSPDLPIGIVIDPGLPADMITVVSRGPGGTVRVQRVTAPPGGERFTNVGATEEGLTYDREGHDSAFPPGAFDGGRVVSFTTQVPVPERAAEILFGGPARRRPRMPADNPDGPRERLARHVEQTMRTLYEREFGRRRHRLIVSPPPPPPGNILDTIDAAVQQQCSCGCGKPITAASPSAYYASPACQQRWMRQHADNAEDVYQRPDAAPYVGVDGAVWPLVDPPPAHPNGTNDDQPTLRLIASPGDDPYGLAYTRYCPVCDGRYQPRVFEDTHVRQFGPAAAIRPINQLIAECGNCEAELPGPVFLSQVVDLAEPPFTGSGFALTLYNEVGRVKHLLSQRRLDRAPDRAALVVRTWEALEQDLTRFVADWQGRTSQATHPIDPRAAFRGGGILT